MIYNPKVYVDQSPIHGWGVFAHDKILEGEVFEECPVHSLPISKGESSPLLIDYRFNWPQGSEWEEQVIPWGFGCLYNHSENSNAYWVSDLDKRVFKFIASRNIEKGEEIFVWYGDVSYWGDGRSSTQVI